MEALTLDQIQVFLAVVEEGGFAKAARKLNRAQSAVTYGVQKLEAQIGMEVFDRAGYRPALTEAGRALLLRARRIADFRAHADRRRTRRSRPAWAQKRAWLLSLSGRRDGDR